MTNLYDRIDDWLERLEGIRRDISLAEIEPDPLYFISIQKRITALIKEIHGAALPVFRPEIIVPMAKLTTSSPIGEEVVSKFR